MPEKASGRLLANSGLENKIIGSRLKSALGSSGESPGPNEKIAGSEANCSCTGLDGEALVGLGLKAKLSNSEHHGSTAPKANPVYGPGQNEVAGPGSVEGPRLTESDPESVKGPWSTSSGRESVEWGEGPVIKAVPFSAAGVVVAIATTGEKKDLEPRGCQSRTSPRARIRRVPGLSTSRSHARTIHFLVQYFPIIDRFGV